MNSAGRNITAIIVSYNRKKELLRCMEAVLKQSYQTMNLLIVDNASTDDTFAYIMQSLYTGTSIPIPCNILELPSINGTAVYYYRSEKNTGGAGGFYTGLKIAREQFNSDHYWLMDDDGYPAPDCLEKLMAVAHKYDYVMPVSINIDKHDELSWATRMKNKRKTMYYQQLKESWGEIMDYVTPFNGSLLSKHCVDAVGYINKDFFIWGDEYEHYWRCRQKNINPVTVLDAVFYHPALKLPLVPIMNGLLQIPYSESKLRMVCLIRNHNYIYLHYDKKIKVAVKFLMYTWLFLITRRFDILGYKLYLQSLWDAFKGDFTRHLKYLD